MALVSVCIPTYNSAHYLGYAIESVLKQQFRDFELVICDDASTDNTPEVCRRYDDLRIRYLCTTGKSGQAGIFNRCVDEARGDYVILLHADDVLMEQYLARAIELLESDKNVGMVHCTVRHIGPDGSPLSFQQLYQDNRIDPGDIRFRQLLLQGCVVNPSGVLVRRSIYQAVGPFCAAVAWGIDWHMWLRVSLKCSVGYLAEPLALYRLHPQSGTSAVMSSGRYGRDEMWVLDDLFRAIPPERTDLLSLYKQARRQVAHRTWCHAEDLCRSEAMSAARAGIRQAISIYPSLLFQSRLWGLLAATYLGYRWFERGYLWKRWVLGR